MKPYVVYHLHSDYSLLDSCTDFSEYVQLAKEQGHQAIASTEHGKPMGWVYKKMLCDEAGIQYIHGVEIYLTESLEEKVRDNYHTVLLARNYEGIRELNRLVGLSGRPDHFYYTNRLTFDEFLHISDNIIKISACLASPLNRLEETHPRYLEIASNYDFLEIQPHHCEEQVLYNQRLFRLAKVLHKPLIAGTDTHSASPYKAECRKILLKRKHKSYGDEDTFDLTWKTRDELEEAFRTQNAIPFEACLEAIENTNRLPEMVEPFELDKSIKYPVLYGSPEEDEEKFAELVEERFADKLARGIIPMEQKDAFRAAIDEEMHVFKSLKMNGFMLSMSDLITWAKNQDMAIGTARGSVGGSRVAYVSDIIDLNPETWRTVFSRFCNIDREEIGDIDIDCVDTDRPKIFQYIEEKYGAVHTGRVASFGTIADLGFIDDAGGALREYWDEEHINQDDEWKKEHNPYSYKKLDKIKAEFKADPEAAKKKYPKLFYFYDGMVGTKVSQSIHPAGIVISPLNLDDEYGIFDKDGERCLFIDMEELHEVGAAKYDLLILKTVQVIRDTCRNIGIPYPRTHEINWNDQDVWKDMLRSPVGIFQFEGSFAFDCLKKFEPHSIFDMSLVTAAIRPSGSSYRDSLLSHEIHHNPSALIDSLLSDNGGFLVYQEDVIKFLQQICGLSGSEADNIRRAIGRKQKDRLDAAMPQILEGYCKKSDQPKEKAESEAMEFLKIIEDASSYMFGYNHSIAYCLLSYLCAYFRFYYPVEFVTAFLNDAANSEDISNGTRMAALYDIKITSPKWGFSTSDYRMNREKKIIAKGIDSIKYLSSSVAEEMFDLAQENQYSSFTDVLLDISRKTHLNTRQRDTLIKIDFFSEFGNQKELLLICEMFEFFDSGNRLEFRKSSVEDSIYEPVIRRYSTDTSKDGRVLKTYHMTDCVAAMKEYEYTIRQQKVSDLEDSVKVKNFIDAMGYSGYISGKDQDRRKLYIKEVFPVKRKKDGVQFGYSVITQSIGSGIESRFTVFNRVFHADPIKEGDVIYCMRFEARGGYFTLLEYRHIR